MKLLRLLMPLAFMAAASSAATQPEEPKLTSLSDAKAGEFVDLTPAFVALAEVTKALPDPDRVKAFHERFDLVVPGYYDDQGDYQARFDGKIATALREFPNYRDRFEAAARSIRPAFERAQIKFKRVLPDYRLDIPVYLLHSIGTQDGGTRDSGGRSAMYFGADVIADIHDSTTIEPFFTHELFHIYHQRFFTDCGKFGARCGLRGWRSIPRPGCIQVRQTGSSF